MQLSLFSILSINWRELRHHFGKRDEAKKDETIGYLLKRNAGLKGEITRIKNNKQKYGNNRNYKTTR